MHFKKIAVLLLVGILSFPSYAKDTEKRHYDKYGRYVGKDVIQDNGTTRKYDKYGTYQGRSVQSGNTAREYDRYGRYTGRSDSRK